MACSGPLEWKIQQFDEFESELCSICVHVGVQSFHGEIGNGENYLT